MTDTRDRDRRPPLTRRAVLGAFAASALPGFRRAGLAHQPSSQPSTDQPEPWSNWSGSVTWNPARVARPTTTDETARLVRAAISANEKVRVAGTGHSFTPLCATSGTTVLQSRMRGIRAIDRDKKEATVLAGTKLYELEEPLREAGFALETLPDIDRQSLAGALATATHGTGLDVPSMSSLVTGATLIDGRGEVVETSIESDASTTHAVQVSLGALGILTEIKLRLVPAFRLHERTRIVPFEQAIEQLDTLFANHRHFEFFWVSERDACLFKTLDPTDQADDLEEFADDSRLVGERVGASGKIFPSRRNTRFNEIEYAVPAARGPECWREIRELMRGKYKHIAWPLEYRMVAPEPALLSMAHGQRVVTLSLHQAAKAPQEPFFRDAEAIFRNHGGRPHWGKMHWLEAAQLRQLYPEWERFLAVRKRLDPKGRFSTAYLDALFGSARE